MAWLAFGQLTRRLADGETVVGSGADADWRVPTADLMPRHFVCTVHGLNTSIRPYSTDVVVVVNGKQLDGTYRLLNEGDSIAAGRGAFVYSDETPLPDVVVAPESAEAAYLIDERADVAYPLARHSSTVGRDLSNAIVIRDLRASRFHAEVRREAGGFVLHSMGAAGTLLNGEAMVTPVLLADGDAIEIAFATFRFTRGPLPPNVVIAPPEAGRREASSTLATGAGRRATIESPTNPTIPPASMAKIIAVVTLVGVLVITGMVWLNRTR